MSWLTINAICFALYINYGYQNCNVMRLTFSFVLKIFLWQYCSLINLSFIIKFQCQTMALYYKWPVNKYFSCKVTSSFRSLLSPSLDDEDDKDENSNNMLKFVRLIFMRDKFVWWRKSFQKLFWCVKIITAHKKMGCEFFC